jgi:hypothetical protein
MRNKKGVSAVVGYVLLIIIAISLSIPVYYWMQKQLPGEPPECPDGAALSVKNYYCDGDFINFTLKNNGLFSVDGFILKIANTSGGLAVYTLKIGDNPENLFKDESNNIRALKPGNETKEGKFSYTYYNQITKFEIEPFIWEDDIVLCDSALLSQEVDDCP